MQHDIIDNRERKLAESVKPLLSESDEMKFAIGYFFISGVKFIAESDNLPSCAISSTMRLRAFALRDYDSKFTPGSVQTMMVIHDI